MPRGSAPGAPGYERGSRRLAGCLSSSAPRTEQNANGSPNLPALIEESVSLPGLAQLRNESHLAQLYVGRHLSARQIAWLTETNRSVVLAALRRCGIPKNRHNRTHPGGSTSAMTTATTAW
jgi:hypothetical protein